MTKVERLKLLIALAIAVTIAASPANALKGAEPGKSLWGISLGSSRATAFAAVEKRLPKAKHQQYNIRSKGLIEDEWAMSDGLNELNFNAFSVKGKIVELRAVTSSKRGQTDLTFAQLIQRHHLQKYVYGFEDPEGGGHVDFYYDDLKRGICFTLGVQDDFLLTYHPDGIIVHRSGVPPIFIESGVRGERMTGRDARAFANQAEANRIEERERNDYR